MEGSSGGLLSTDTASMSSTCAICKTKTEELMLLEQYQQDNMEMKVPLRDVILALCGKKELPFGSICKNCLIRAEDAWKFQKQLETANQEPSLSDKIRILRHRLKQLTQKIDVFIVVGPEKKERNTENTEYSEDNVIMVDKNLPDDPFLDELEAETALECSICSEDFSNDLEILEHLKTHPSDATHTCRVCECGFSTRHQLISHRLRHKLKDSRECPKCLTVFKAADELSQHECQILCPACSNVFDDRVELSKHIRSNHDVTSHDSSYACPICFEAFNTGFELANHLQTHGQTNQYICGHDGCVKRFSTQAQLLGHIDETHSKVQETSGSHQEVKLEFECGICQRTFASEKSLKTHATRLHNNIRKGCGHPRSRLSSMKFVQSEVIIPEPLKEINMKQLDYKQEEYTLEEENVASLEDETNVEDALDDDDYQMVYVGVEDELPEGISYINGDDIDQV